MTDPEPHCYCPAWGAIVVGTVTILCRSLTGRKAYLIGNPGDDCARCGQSWERTIRGLRDLGAFSVRRSTLGV